MSIDFAGMHPELRPYAEYCLKLARINGLHVTVTSVQRGWAEQTQLRARYERCLALYGRTGPDLPQACHYPANAPGDSAHQPWGGGDGRFGALAFDSSVPESEQATWDAIRRYVGFRVPANDHVHAELPNWRQQVAQVRR